MADTITISMHELDAFMRALLAAAGADEASGAAVADSLLVASTRGIDTHGIILLPHYLRALEGGRINGKPRMRYEQRAPAVGHLDADDGFGHLAGYRAIEHGCAVAEQLGIASVAVSNSSHYGAGASYVVAAAQRGFIALAVSHSDAVVVPQHGVRAFNGTNPISFAAPVPGDEPVLVDLATSSIAWNRLSLLQARGLPMPDDVALARDGSPATDYRNAASLRPLGGSAFGHKGAALASMVDILSSALTGMLHGMALLPMDSADLATPRRLGHCFIVMKPTAFVPLQSYEERMQSYLAELRAQPAAGDQPVQAPGDPEKLQLRRRSADGVPIEAVTWRELRTAAQRYGTPVPSTLPGSADPG